MEELQVAQLDRLTAQKLTKDLKTRFNLIIDRVVNFVDYGKDSVKFKFSGDDNDANDDVLVRQGTPFTPVSRIPAKEIVAYIQANYPKYKVTLSYGHLLSGHHVPHAKIKCEQL